MADNRLFKFYVDFGRSGALEGVFVATRAEVEWHVGRQVFFGEVLGKHSDVYFDLEAGHVTEMDTPDGFVDAYVRLFGSGSGHSPLGLTACDRCGEDGETAMADDGEAVCTWCSRPGEPTP